MAYRKDWVSIIRQDAPKYGIDPRAALAVSRMEGLSGAVGDHGTSFGPFQMHVGGALPAGRGRAWAESRAGINYALRQMSSHASGLTGKSAINAIVRQFERPANPNREVAGAIGVYGQGLGGAGHGLVGAAFNAGAGVPSFDGSGQASGASGDFKQQLISSLLNASANGGQMQPGTLIGLALARQSMGTGQTPNSGSGGGSGAPAHAGTGSVSFLGDTHGMNPQFLHNLSTAVSAAGASKVQVISGYRSPAHNKAVGGVPRSNHTTGNAMDGKAYLPGKGWAPLGVLLQHNPYGIRSGNQPGFYQGGRDPNHVDNAANQR